MSEYNPLYDETRLDQSGHTARYFNERGCRIDARGTFQVHPESRWGFFVTVITLSHQRSKSDTTVDGALVDRPVIVERNAWICSNAVLYNCRIGEGAIVSVGSVVRSQEVAPYVMVAGNPARVIARQIDGEWIYARPKWEVLS